MHDEPTVAENEEVNPVPFDHSELGEFNTLDEVLKQVGRGRPRCLPVEDVLRLVGNKKRGKHVRERISELLVERGLEMRPEIDVADYYGSVVIMDPRDRLTSRSRQAGLPIAAIAQGSAELFSVEPSADLRAVRSEMLLRDFSQVPVVKNAKRDLVGTITWRSLSQNPTAKVAKDAVEGGAFVAHSSDDLMTVVPLIIEDDFVYYRNPAQEIIGILTSSDLAQVFLETTGNYLRLSEIESRLRVLLDRLPLPELKRNLDPNATHKTPFRGASDMSFGEYVRVLQHRDLWDRLSIDLDRRVCLQNLSEVQDARNNLMHFRSEALDDNEVAEISKCLRWLRSVTP